MNWVPGGAYISTTASLVFPLCSSSYNRSVPKSIRRCSLQSLFYAKSRTVQVPLLSTNITLHAYHHVLCSFTLPVWNNLSHSKDFFYTLFVSFIFFHLPVKSTKVKGLFEKQSKAHII